MLLVSFAFLGLCASTEILAIQRSTRLTGNFTAQLQDWNKLVNGEGIFEDGPSSSQSQRIKNCSDASAVLNLFTHLLSEDAVVEEAYHKYKLIYKEPYEQDRLSIAAFKKKLVEVAAHNLEADCGRHGWWMGVNQFTDLTLTELNEQRPQSKLLKGNATTPARPYTSTTQVSLRDNLNYVRRNQVSSVKNQHGGAYAEQFAVASVVESSPAFGTYKPTVVSLSVQELIDCVPSFCAEYSGDCQGDKIQNLFSYAVSYGLSAVTRYPYSNPPTQGTCHSSESGVVTAIKSQMKNTENTETGLRQLLTDNGPVLVQIYASDLLKSSYHGGVYSGSECESYEANHAVVLVGYGSGGGSDEDYWLIKNSWGSKWGEQGYLRLTRNKGENVCGILNVAYSVVNSF